jgi:dihydrofolate synthase/folylpolyglutamate synthase
VPVITAADEPEALGVIEKTAREKNAPLIKVISACLKLAALFRGAATLPLPGEHQKLNAALALATVETLQSEIPVSAAAIRTGLETVNWPGRLQLVQTNPAKKSCSTARTMLPARKHCAKRCGVQARGTLEA